MFTPSPSSLAVGFCNTVHRVTNAILLPDASIFNLIAKPKRSIDISYSAKTFRARCRCQRNRCHSQAVEGCRYLGFLLKIDLPDTAVSAQMVHNRHKDLTQIRQVCSLEPPLYRSFPKAQARPGNRRMIGTRQLRRYSENLPPPASPPIVWRVHLPR